MSHSFSKFASLQHSKLPTAIQISTLMWIIMQSSFQIWDKFWRALFGQSQHKSGMEKKGQVMTRAVFHTFQAPALERFYDTEYKAILCILQHIFQKNKSKWAPPSSTPYFSALISNFFKISSLKYKFCFPSCLEFSFMKDGLVCKAIAVWKDYVVHLRVYSFWVFLMTIKQQFV